jgi:hypothetical protein
VDERKRERMLTCEKGNEDASTEKDGMLEKSRDEGVRRGGKKGMVIEIVIWTARGGEF